MEKVAILCPISESVPVGVFQHTLALVAKSMRDGIHIDQIGVTERQLVHSARNILAKGFLETDCEWSFWIDADMIIPSDTLTRLMESAKQNNAKMISGVYYQRVGDHRPVLWKKDPVTLKGEQLYSNRMEKRNGTPSELENRLDPECEEMTREACIHTYVCPSAESVRPFKADVCGFGCVLVHREIFEKTEYPWFKMLSDICSEDFYFCIKAKKAGYQLWADPKPRLGHIGVKTVVYRENFFEKYKDVDLTAIKT